MAGRIGGIIGGGDFMDVRGRKRFASYPISPLVEPWWNEHPHPDERMHWDLSAMRLYLEGPKVLPPLKWEEQNKKRETGDV